MSAATGDFEFFDFGAAVGAGEAGFIEDLGKKIEVVTAGAVGFKVIFKGATTGINGAFHDGFGAFEDFYGIFFGDSAGGATGIDSGEKEGFVGVNVTETGHYGLV